MCAPFMLSIEVLQNNRLVVDFFRGLPAPLCFHCTSFCVHDGPPFLLGAKEPRALVTLATQWLTGLS